MMERRGQEELRLLCAGPGRLGQALAVSREMNGKRIDRRPFRLTAAELPSSDGFAARVPQSFETNWPGIFAVGDVRCGSVKRVAAAVGEGSACVQQVHQVLHD